jgi:hypothetical protein
VMAFARRRLAERGEVALKGLRGLHSIYSVEWRQQPAPASARRTMTARRDDQCRPRGARRLHAVSSAARN